MFDEGLQVLIFIGLVADSGDVSAQSLLEVLREPIRKLSRAELEALPEYWGARSLFEAGRAARDKRSITSLEVMN